jgi:hypothetical protein
MYNVEQQVVNDPNYVNFCKAVSSSDSSCDPAAYTSFAKNFASNINTITQTDVDTYLATIAGSESVYLNNYLFMEKSFTRTNLVSKKARAIFLFASPIQYKGTRYKTYTEDEFDQRADFIKFSEEIEEKVTDYSTSLDVKFYNEVWYDSEVEKLIMTDFLLAAACFVFVLLYIAFHIKSFFMSSAAMFFVSLSFPVTLLFTRFIFRVDYFTPLNLVAIFVILGISADDIFVFMDSWNQTKQHRLLNPDTENRLNNLQLRMNYTWRRTTKSIFSTSFTTAVAFLATGFSKIMPVAAFGYFASALVIMNFFYAILTFPACVILYERYFIHRCKYRKYISEKCSTLFKW